MSNFFTLNIARRAMQVSTQALNITAHNVANASTPGFSRQRAVIETTSPHLKASLNRPTGPGQIGTGVEVSSIIRVRSELLDLQVRGQNSAMGFWQAKHESLSHLGGVFLEPSENGLNTSLEQFWSAWQEVAKNPTSNAVRTSLLESANALTSTFQSISIQSNNLLDDINQQVSLKVAQVNNLSENIAALNTEIASARAVGYEPNDLMDKRDMLLDDLSRLADIKVHHQETGSINVSFGGKILIQDTKVFALETQVQDGQVLPIWQRDGSSMELNQGELAGLKEAYRFIKEDMLGGLNELAKGLAEEINAVHHLGLDANGVNGGDFLSIPGYATGQEAAHISLAIGLQGNPAGIAAAGVSGYNETALAISALRSATTMSGGQASFHNYFNSLVTNLGFEAKTSGQMAMNHELLGEQVAARRQSISGVSIDEEITHMIQFQHSYQAAAKVISTVDSLLGTLINEMGRR